MPGTKCTFLHCPGGMSVSGLWWYGKWSRHQTDRERRGSRRKVRTHEVFQASGNAERQLEADKCPSQRCSASAQVTAQGDSSNGVALYRRKRNFQGGRLAMSSLYNTCRSQFDGYRCVDTPGPGFGAFMSASPQDDCMQASTTTLFGRFVRVTNGPISVE